MDMQAFTETGIIRWLFEKFSANYKNWFVAYLFSLFIISYYFI